jgi:hypothetical protein
MRWVSANKECLDVPERSLDLVGAERLRRLLEGR